jgi:hypothetical protein
MSPMALGLGEGGEQMYRQAQLAVQTRDWSQRLFGLSTDSKATLVALLDQPGMKRGAVALGKAADRKRGVAFTPNTMFALSTN